MSCLVNLLHVSSPSTGPYTYAQVHRFASHCRVRKSNFLSYAQPPTPIDPVTLGTPGAGGTPKTLAGLLGVPAGTPSPKRPWQLLAPGEPFDPATAPEGVTVRDQV